VNTPPPTLGQSQLFSFRVPKSQSAETDVNFAIRPEKVISSILVLIVVIHKNKLYVNCLCPYYNSSE